MLWIEDRCFIQPLKIQVIGYRFEKKKLREWQARKFLFSSFSPSYSPFRLNKVSQISGQIGPVFLFSIALVLFCFCLVVALECWSCNNFDAFCNDPFDSSKLTEVERVRLIDCTDGVCVKSTANIKGILCLQFALVAAAHKHM